MFRSTANRASSRQGTCLGAPLDTRSGTVSLVTLATVMA